MNGQFTADDLRASVAAGHLSEAQAATILAQAAARAGQRAALAPDDEPFELFRGFAEIFVSVGLILLISGALTLGAAVGGFFTPAIAAAVCWAFALYFTRKRRMTLPSIVLVTGYALGIAASLGILLGNSLDSIDILDSGRMILLLYGVLVLAALALWYRAFKVPFTMFLCGLTGLGLVFVLTDSLVPLEFGIGWDRIFDLRQGSGLAIGTLIFGVSALVAGLWFDMRDPYRLGRWSASGFWLHILAAPALVNTVALTAYNTGGTAGNVALAVTLVAVALLALIIDRRSFLTAGIGYLGILLAWALRSEGDEFSVALLLLILGAFLTFMGAFWTQLRARLMRTLPDFPGKNRLPPYAETP